MHNVPDFSFLTELTVSSERMQASLQEAYEYAVRAERNIETNPERYCSFVRESARYLTKAYGIGAGLPAPDSYGLDNYATDRDYEDRLSGDLGTQLTYLRRYTAHSRGQASMDTRVNLVRYLHSYAKGIYHELGGKGRPSDRKISVPSAPPVKERFPQSSDKQESDRMIEELLREIIPDGAAAEQIARETRDLQKSCMEDMNVQVRDMRTQIKGLLENFSGRFGAMEEQMQRELQDLRKEIDQKLQKMSQDSQNQNAAQARSLRQFQDLLDQILSARSRQILSQDDLMARLSALEEKLDQIEKKNEASQSEMQQFARDLAQTVASYYQDNRQPLEELGGVVRDLGVGLLRAGKTCLQTAAAFAQKAGAAAEKITQETRQQADQLVREAKRRAEEASDKDVSPKPERSSAAKQKTQKSIPGTSFGAGIGPYIRSLFDGWSLGKWCKRLSVSESLKLHSAWNAFCVTGLLLYFLLFYVLASDHVMALPALIARFSGCLWYALSFFLFPMARLSLYFTAIRIAAGLLDRFLRKLPVRHVPFWKKAARAAVLAVILYFLSRYCYENFYRIARDGFGWKQLFLAAGPGEVGNMVRWCLTVWGAR